jgi:transposase
LIATERLRKRVRAAQYEWRHRRTPRMRLEPHRLVFIDETGVTTKMTRLRGRSRCRTRLEADAPFGHWQTQTFIAGLSIDELTAPWVLDGPMNRAAFETDIETQLAPVLQPGDVVIADNLSSHRSARAQACLKAQGNWMLFLPPYSPDLNPIEMAYAKLKAHLRRAKARTFEALFQSVAQTCDLFPAQECLNFFKAAGYVAD